MKIEIVIAILETALHCYLSTRKHFIFGLIIPVFIVIGAILFGIFIAPHAKESGWVFRFVMLLFYHMSIYIIGREKVKNKKKKELEKMTIKDL